MRKIFNSENSELFYETLFNAVADAIFIMQDDKYIDCNSKSAELFDCSYEDIIGKTPFDLSPDLQVGDILSKEIGSDYLKQVYSGATVNFSWIHRKFTGELFNACVTLTPMKHRNTNYALAVVRDTTEIILALKQIRESEEKFSKVFQVNPLAMGIIAVKDGRFIDINEGFTKVLGYTREDVINKTSLEDNLWDKLMSSDLTREKWVQELLKNGKIINFEAKIRAKNGKIITSSISAELFTLGNVLYSIYVLEDITNKKEDEEKLRKSEELYRTLIETSQDGISLADLDGKIILCNARKAEMFGYGAAEKMIGVVSMQLIAPEEMNTVYQEFGILMQKGYIPIMEHTAVRKDGTTFDAEFSASVIYNQNGSPGMIMDIVRDITDRKAATEAIIKSEARYRYIFETAAVGLWEIDLYFIKNAIDESKRSYRTFEEYIEAHPDFYQEASKKCRNIDLNNYSVALYEAESKEHLLENINCIIPVENYKDFRNIIFAMADGLEYYSFESYHRTLKGKRIDVHISITFPRNTDDYHRVLYSVTDISVSKQIEKELQSAKSKTEMLNNAKTQFFSTISHELRTPLNGILGFSKLLESQANDNEQKEISSMIFSSGNRLLKTLNKILDLTKLEAEKYEPKLIRLNLSEVLRKILNSYKPLVEQKNLYLDIQIKNENLYSMLDLELLNGILINLTENAVKYTESGGITVCLSMHELSGRQYSLINIKDTGIGIPKEKLEIIFEEFRQASEGYGRNFEGTGLGLSITKKSVELMKGFIDVESIPGKGTNFLVFFPLDNIGDNNMDNFDLNKINNENMNQQEMVEVLLVEDDFVSQSLTSIALRKICVIDIADNGSEAVEKAKQKKYGLILMDINLGKGLTGLDAAKQIRSLPGYENTPIIALTAYALMGDKEEFLSQGCTHYVSKPFDIHELSFLVKSLLQQ